MPYQSGLNAVLLPQKHAIARAVSAAIVGSTGAMFAPAATAQIEEVIVTATKREQSLQDIPASVQALTSEDIRIAGIQSSEDYVRFIPGLSATSLTPGSSKLTFRGVGDASSTFIADATSAIYLDEQPLTTVSQAPDPYMCDIERVEALAGPQGTLYGSSSQSGTLRIITNKPDASKFSGMVDGGVDFVDGGGTGYDGCAVANVPLLEDKLAIRLVGFHSRDAGYIDNVLGNTPSQPAGGGAPKPTTGVRTNANVVDNNINTVDWYGGRVAAKWFINEDWSALVSGTYQKTDADGWNNYDPSVGELDTIKFIEEDRRDRWYQLGLTIEGDLGFVTVLSNSSYFNRKINYVEDRTTYANYFHWVFGFYYGFQGYNFGDDPISFNTLDQQDWKFAQEIRLSHDGEGWDWILGGFYERTRQTWSYKTFIPGYANSPALAYWNYLSYIGYLQCPDVACPSPLRDPNNAWWHSFTRDNREQYAVFMENTFSFTDNVDIIAGFRYYDHTRSIFYGVQRPQFRPDRPASEPSGGDSGFLPKVAIQYNFADDKMLYALYSEGFRAGGTNRARGTPTFPVQYDADKLINYEFGLKSQWLENTLQVNLTGYHMKWVDYQLEVNDPSFQPPINEPFQTVVGNVGDAEINGFDFDINWQPMEGLQLAANGTYLFKAEVAEDFTITDPRAPGIDFGLGIDGGTRLPLFADFNMAASATYTWPFSIMEEEGEAYVRFQWSYTGSSVASVTGDPPPAFFGNGQPKLNQPAYHVGDLKIGFRNEKWEANAFVNNLWDERQIYLLSVANFDYFWGRQRAITGKPRTFGLRITRYF